MNQVIWYNPRSFRNLVEYKTGKIDQFLKFSELIRVPLIDRTCLINTVASFKSLVSIPEVTKTQKTFSDICDIRAAELVSKSQYYAKVRLYWSGGIDSTCSLVSFLRCATPEFLSKLEVIITKRSIKEYPLFFENYIKGRLKYKEVVLVKDTHREDTLTITGELGDQLFGSAILGVWKDLPEVFSKDYQKYLRLFLINSLQYTENDVLLFLNCFEPFIESCPYTIKTTYDFFWWLNFGMKWQDVSLRFHNGLISKSVLANCEHFFECVEFQRWAITNPDLKIKDTWESYKYPAKQYILNYTGDMNYFLYKVKEGSLGIGWAYSGFSFVDVHYKVVRYGKLGYSHIPKDYDLKYSNYENVWS